MTTIWDNIQYTIGTAKRYDDSVRWQLTVSGLSIDGAAVAPYGDLVADMAMIFGSYGTYISSAAIGIFVPVELMAAMIGLVVDAVGTDLALIQNYRHELPGFVDDDTTPERVAIGCAGILLSAARTMTGNPTLTASALMDVTTNINACASLIASQVNQNKLDPIYVAAIYNNYALLYSEASRWRMKRFDGDDTAIDRYVNWFNAAVYQQRTTKLTGANYADSLTALASVALPVPPTVQQYHTIEAQALIQQSVTVTSTASPVLNDYWPVYGPSWTTIASVAVAFASGLGLPGGGSTTTISNADGIAVTVTGDQLTTLYNGLRTFVSAITDYDTGVATALPTPPVTVA